MAGVWAFSGYIMTHFHLVVQKYVDWTGDLTLMNYHQSIKIDTPCVP